MRLITVVMGEPSSKVRNEETVELLNYGFSTYKVDIILKSDDIIGKKKVFLGEIDNVEIVSSKDIKILNSKTGTKRNVTYKTSIKDIKAPIKKGDIVGKINVIEDGNSIMEIDATVNKDIKKASIFKIYTRDVLDMIKGPI